MATRIEDIIEALTREGQTAGGVMPIPRGGRGRPTNDVQKMKQIVAEALDRSRFRPTNAGPLVATGSVDGAKEFPDLFNRLKKVGFTREGFNASINMMGPKSLDERTRHLFGRGGGLPVSSGAGLPAVVREPKNFKVVDEILDAVQEPQGFNRFSGRAPLRDVDASFRRTPLKQLPDAFFKSANSSPSFRPNAKTGASSQLLKKLSPTGATNLSRAGGFLANVGKEAGKKGLLRGALGLGGRALGMLTNPWVAAGLFAAPLIVDALTDDEPAPQPEMEFPDVTPRQPSELDRIMVAIARNSEAFGKQALADQREAEDVGRTASQILDRQAGIR